MANKFDAVKKMKMWRGLQWLVNLPPVEWITERTSGTINRLAALPQKRRPVDTLPWTPFKKKLADASIALVTTAGIHLGDQEPFDIDSAEGDASYRIIPSDCNTAELRVTHAHFSHARFNEDYNVLFPIDILREMVRTGEISSLATNFYSFGFGAGLTKEYIDPQTGTAHEIAKRLKQEGADAVLLVPA